VAEQVSAGDFVLTSSGRHFLGMHDLSRIVNRGADHDRSALEAHAEVLSASQIKSAASTTSS